MIDAANLVLLLVVLLFLFRLGARVELLGRNLKVQLEDMKQQTGFEPKPKLTMWDEE